MSYVLEFEIQDLPKMANLRSGKSHWRYAHQEASKWKDLVWKTVGLNKPKAPLERARLTLTRYSGSEPDYDGLVRGFKSVVDGLRACGVIHDDKLANTGPWTCTWERAPRGQGKIRVRVEEVTDETADC